VYITEARCQNGSSEQGFTYLSSFKKMSLALFAVTLLLWHRENVHMHIYIYIL
jgi:hypothetical protein